MNAVIIDDVDLNRNSLKRLIEKYCSEIKVLGSADGVESGISLLKQNMPDIVFLDIEMKDGSGFDLLHYFPHRTFEVIFVTAYDKYALEALKSSALEYLLKPIDIEELKKAVSKAIEKFNSSKVEPPLFSSKIAFSTSTSIDLINPKEMIRCKADGKYTECFFSNGDIRISSKNLKEFEILLLKHHFIRVHDSHLINLNHVIRFKKEDGGFILLSNGDEVPVSQRKKKTFLASLDLL